jgi:hypothetical protein
MPCILAVDVRRGKASPGWLPSRPVADEVACRSHCPDTRGEGGTKLAGRPNVTYMRHIGMSKDAERELDLVQFHEAIEREPRDHPMVVALRQWG